MGKLIDTDGLAIFKANMLNSPALSGTPTAPTAAESTNSTQIATTAFVKNAVEKSKGIYFVNGTQVSATSSWTGNLTDVETLTDGLAISYRLPYDSTSTAVTLTLTLAAGSSNAIPVYYTGDTRVTDQYTANSIITLVYYNNSWRSADGDNEIYVGTEEPTDPNVDIWINPEGNTFVGGGVSDVKINNISIVSNGVATIPAATVDTYGVMKRGDGLGYDSASGKIYVDYANASNIKVGTDNKRAISPYTQHQSVFYGLAKAAGADMKDSSNVVGTYTPAAKQAIQTMLGIEADTTPTQNSTNYITSGGVYNALQGLGLTIVDGALCVNYEDGEE